MAKQNTEYYRGTHEQKDGDVSKGEEGGVRWDGVEWDGNGDDVTVVCYVRRVRVSRYRETENKTHNRGSRDAGRPRSTCSISSANAPERRFAGGPCVPARIAFRRARLQH